MYTPLGFLIYVETYLEKRRNLDLKIESSAILIHAFNSIIKEIESF